MRRRDAILFFGIGIGMLNALGPVAAAPVDKPMVLAKETADPPPQPNESPEAKMARRFPQKVKVGDLIGLPILDDNDVTLGHVQKVVRTPDGKIRLIVSYSR